MLTAKDKKRYLDNYCETTIIEYQLGLTKEDQEKIFDKFINKNLRNLLEVARDLYLDNDIVQSDEKYKNLRKYIARLKEEHGPYYDYNPIQRQQIEDLGPRMPSSEITKTLFPAMEPLKVSLSKENLTIVEYLKAVGKRYKNENNLVDKRFEPPTRFTAVIKLINDAVYSAKLSPNDIGRDEKQCVMALMDYLRTPRFLQTINLISDVDDRSMFLNEFIKHTYNKKDLTPEDVNDYITLCDLFRDELNVKKQMELIDKTIINQISSADDDESANARHSLVELSEKIAKRLDNVQTQISKLHKALNSTRSDRLKDMKDIGSSLAPYVEQWRDKSKQQRYLRIAQAKDLDIAKEIDRIADFGELIAEVNGVSKEEILFLDEK